MESVETEGNTIDEAIENALRLLGVGREKITVDILAEGRKGILGFGAQKAKVRAALRGSAIDLKTSESDLPAESTAAAPDSSVTAEKAKAVLTETLRLMGFAATVEEKTAHNGTEIILQITADNSGLLIGRKGQTLEALQYLVTRISGEREGSDEPHIVVDIENYRERQRRSLEDMALRMGEKAKRQRKTVVIDALSAADRRAVHAVLQDDPWLTTKSLGQGPYRRLLIIPEGDRKTKEGANPPVQERPGARPRKQPTKPTSAHASEDDEE
jgi:spoIIIJ-associated protein